MHPSTEDYASPNPILSINSQNGQYGRLLQPRKKHTRVTSPGQPCPSITSSCCSHRKSVCRKGGSFLWLALGRDSSVTLLPPGGRASRFTCF